MMNPGYNGTPGGMAQFPIMGPAIPSLGDPAIGALNLGPDQFGQYCHPIAAYRTIPETCGDIFPADSGDGRQQRTAPYTPPISSGNNLTQQRFPTGYELGLLGAFQVTNIDSQNQETYNPLGIDKSFHGNFDEWVTGPWIAVYQQEVYHQYNASLLLPWG